MNQTANDAQIGTAQAAERLGALESSIGKALVGQRQVVREAVVALAAAGHVLLEGVPGIGKTLLVRALAAAVAGGFRASSSHPI
jgi:MoxR-like ATPase